VKIEKFEFRNFKGILHAQLDLTANPRSKIFTLVGLNESGKTTILEAINFFKYKAEDLKVLNLPGHAIKDVHGVIPLSLMSNFNGRVSIRATFSLEPTDKKALAEYLKEKHNCLLKSISDSILIKKEHEFEDSKLKQDHHIWTIDLEVRMPGARKDIRTTAKDAVWQDAMAFLGARAPSILYFPNFLFDLPERIYLQDKSGSDDQIHRFYRTILQDILDSLNEGLTLEKHIVARISSSDKNAKNALEQTLSKVGSAVTSSVFSRWNSFFSSNSNNREIRFEYGLDEQGTPFICLRLKDGVELYDLSQRSLGFRWFFTFLLLTHYRGFRKGATQDVLFLFDEPASNLHSTAQAELLKSFTQFPKNCCVIYTTHSHHLINPEWLEGTYVVRNEALQYGGDDNYKAKDSKITLSRYRDFVSKHPSQFHFFQPVLDVLDYRPSNLEMVPSIVMVEGKNDYYTLALASKTIPNLDVRLLPGGGAGSLDPLIRLYTAWGRNFIILLDGDSEGRRQRKRYSEMFGSLIDSKIFDLGDVNKAFVGKGLEAVLDRDELLIFQRFFYPLAAKFDKKILNRAMQEALLTKTSQELGPLSLSRLNEILQFLKIKLESAAKY